MGTGMICKLQVLFRGSQVNTPAGKLFECFPQKQKYDYHNKQVRFEEEHCQIMHHWSFFLKYRGLVSMVLR